MAVGMPRLPCRTPYLTAPPPVPYTVHRPDHSYSRTVLRRFELGSGRTTVRCGSITTRTRYKIQETWHSTVLTPPARVQAVRSTDCTEGYGRTLPTDVDL